MTDRVRPARAPLGRVFDGLCHADAVPARPEGDVLHELCNFGYGRGRCPRFPENSPADAIRFTDHAGQVLWILEREYAPLAHGVVAPDDPDGVRRRQAEAWRSA